MASDRAPCRMCGQGRNHGMHIPGVPYGHAFEAASQSINPPCERCDTMTLVHSDHSGGWLECPNCHWMQGIRHTPGGSDGVLTGMDPNVTHGERAEGARSDGDV